MPSFHHGDVEIAYLDEGEGDPVVLVHGFASSKNVNWVYPTWVSELRKNGFRVIAFDNRGHGDSSKLYDPEDYHIGTMASDITALMDHLGIERADVMGYSLGARMMGILAQTKPQRVRSAIFGGLGIGLIKGGGPGENVAKAEHRSPFNPRHTILANRCVERGLPSRWVESKRIRPSRSKPHRRASSQSQPKFTSSFHRATKARHLDRSEAEWRDPCICFKPGEQEK